MQTCAFAGRCRIASRSRHASASMARMSRACAAWLFEAAELGARACVPAILEVSAISALGGSWRETWRALLSGARAVTRSDGISQLSLVDAPICAVSDLDRQIDAAGVGPAQRLLGRALAGLSISAGGTGAHYRRSHHGESGLIALLRGALTPAQARGLLLDPVPGAYRRWTYAACSSGLHALASAVLDITEAEQPSALVSAVDALSEIELAGFKRVKALSE